MPSARGRVHVAAAPQAAVVAPAAAPRVLRADTDPAPESKPGPSKDPSQPDLGAHGPKLLPRPRRPQLDRMGGAGGPPGGGGPGSGGTQRVIGNLVAYSGIVGTTAIVLAGVAGIDVWESFRWSDTQDLVLAAALSVPLQAANAALLLPSYSALKLPQLADLQTMEANLKYDKEQREAAAARAAAATTSGAAAEAAAPEAAAASSGAAPEASGAAGAITASVAVPDTGAGTPSPASASASTSASPASASASAPPPPPAPAPLPPGGLVPASNWGAGGGPGGPGGGADVDRAVVLGVDVTGLRDALHLAQGHIVSNNPTARINAGLEAAFAAVDTAAGELLYRGVALTWLAAWLEDRIYEAGAEEVLTQQLPAALGATLGPAAAGAAEQLGVFGDCEVAVAAGLVGYTVWAVLARNRREVARLEALMDAVGRGISKASAKNALNGDASAKRGGGVATTVVMGPGAIPIAASAAGGPLNGGAGGAGGGGGPLNGKQAALEVMTRGATVRAVRDALQVATINAVFIASGGNLAASYAAALANQLLISAWQRVGARRMRERSSALAKELKAYNAEMQRILAKYTHKLPPVAREQVAAMEAETASSSATSSSSSSSTGGPSAASSSSSSSLQESTSASAAATTSLASVAGEAAGRAGSGQSSSGSSSSGSSIDRGTPAVLASGEAGKLQSALSALSFLVPEPEPPARSKGGAKAATAPAAAAPAGGSSLGTQEKS